MKPFITLIALLTSMHMAAQIRVEADEKQTVMVNPAEHEYIYVSMAGGGTKSDVAVYVDYGQSQKMTLQHHAICDESRKRMLFNSEVHALNYLHQQGYEVVLRFTGFFLNKETAAYLLRAYK
jgi:hypothetical protein